MNQIIKEVLKNVIEDDDNENNIEQQQSIPMKYISGTIIMIKVNAKCELVLADCNGINDEDS